MNVDFNSDIVKDCPLSKVEISDIQCYETCDFAEDGTIPRRFIPVDIQHEDDEVIKVTCKNCPRHAKYFM